MSLELSDGERAELLAIARRSIEGGDAAGLSTEGSLGIRCGAFVSLHKDSRLRGCIGRMASDEPLSAVVAAMARAAAYEDPRFRPLSPAEFDSVDIEISVLSPMEPCAPDDIVPGVHGAYLSLGYRSGVFLPQVATEQGWDRLEFLRQLCGKAGLPPDSYRATGARLSRFTAVVFGER